MNITIKPLTPELSEDYFDFFEKILLANSVSNKIDMLTQNKLNEESSHE